MTFLWAPAMLADTTSYSPLWCAQGDRHLHVAIEGPHESPPQVVEGQLPKLAHIVIRGDTGWTNVCFSTVIRPPDVAAICSSWS